MQPISTKKAATHPGVRPRKPLSAFFFLLSTALDWFGTRLLRAIDAFWAMIAALADAGKRVFLRIAGKAEVPTCPRNLDPMAAVSDLTITHHASRIAHKVSDSLTPRLSRRSQTQAEAVSELTPRTI